jgi:NTE family protein
MTTPRLTTARRPRTAFVLSGGASLGALQVGMLHALYDHGVTPDLLVGTSAGALNAAFVASRPQTAMTAIELARVWRTLQRQDVFPITMSSVVRGLCSRHDHLISHRGLRELIGRHLEFEDLADAAIPVHVVAFDLAEGREVLLSDGPALEAVAASASIPGVFPAVQLGDRRLVDGGIANNTPISHAVELGAERIYVLPTQDPGRSPAAPRRSALDVTMDALGVLVDSRFAADIARYSSEVELMVLPAANPARVHPTSFEHASSLIAGARAAARRCLASAGDSRLALAA